MPWPTSHKDATRKRIVEAAAAAFRERGVAGVSVGDVMRDAGLTHGGFYAHFASKDALLAEAVHRASEQTTDLLDLDAAASHAGVLSVVERYLSPAHAAHPEWGCPIAALGAELARSDAGVRRSLREEIGKRLAAIRARFGRRASSARRDRDAAAVFACMVGGIVLARGLGGEDGEALLAHCRTFLRDALKA